MKNPLPLPQLDPKHLVWIVDAAIESFEAKVKVAEIEIVRHSILDAQNLLFINRQGYTREIKIQSHKEFLLQYMDILFVLYVLRDKAADFNAEQAAQAFADYLKQKK